MKLSAALLASTCLLLISCASIIEGSSDDIEVVTSQPAALSCSAVNARGNWTVYTPGTIKVKRSRSAMDVTCTDPATGAASVNRFDSDVEAWAFGNILLGGIIGLGVDWTTGAAYDYPNQVTIPLQTLQVGGGAALTPAPTNAFTPALQPVAAPIVAPVAAPIAAPAPVEYYAPAPAAPSFTAPAAQAPVQYYAPPVVPAAPVQYYAPAPTAPATLPFGGPTPAPAY